MIVRVFFSVMRSLIHSLTDNPSSDGSDRAHPAWWRGYDAAFAVSEKEIQNLRSEVNFLSEKLRSGK